MSLARTAPAPDSVSVIRLALTAAMGGLLFGYDSAVINGAVDAIRLQFEVGPGPLGFAVAAALIGAAIGAFFGGRIADKFGRIPVMKVAAVLFLISAIGSALAPEIISLVAFRILGGLGMGVASIIAPAYIAEVAPAHIRGRLGSLQQLAIVVGIFLSLLVNAILAGMAGGAAEDLWLGMPAWRWMLGIEALPCVLYLVGAYLIPESPRYLVARGRGEEAFEVLDSIKGMDDPKGRLARIEESLRSETEPSFRDLRGSVMGLKRIVWLGVALAALQQLVGINVIFYYSTTLWASVGFSESDSFAISVFTSVVNVVITIVAIVLIDKVGRRPLLIVGSGGMALTLGTMAYLFGTAPLVEGEPALGAVAGPVALVAANLFVMFFGVSWGPVMWVMLGEMFPNRIRGAALALAGLTQWVANWLVTVTFPALSDLSLGVAYGIYALFAVVSFVLVIKVMPETKGLELEDMTD